MLYHIPIEPYKTRYTADWISQYESEFINNDIEFVTILGDSVTDTIGQEGNVLDAIGTNIYKNSQMNSILNLFANNKINDDDIFFFCDLWFPSIEMLFYIRNLTNIRFKIAGILHAGTYDCNDFTYRSGMRKWGKYLESCWLSEIDYIFVATHYHKNLIQSNTLNEMGNIFVTGIPFYADKLREQYANDIKENIVVFPHRVAPEKHPELFDRLGFIVNKKRPDIKFIKTIESTNNRKEYFNLLARSKIMISFAEQETFGYSTVEAMALGNYVLVPDRLSYRETVPSYYRYDECESLHSIADMICKFIDYTQPTYYDLSKWSDSIKNMIQIIKEI